ncbi:MAG: heavy metal translocating P-type ATPase [Pseudomonadota bacterium]
MALRHPLPQDGPPHPTPSAGALPLPNDPSARQVTQFHIEGLHCASCVARVEARFKAEPKVLNAEVNLATGTATLTHRAEPDLAQRIESAAREIGYEARLRAPEEQAGAGADKVANAKRRALVALALALPVFVTEMARHFVPGAEAMFARLPGPLSLGILHFLLTTAILLGPARGILVSGFQTLRRGAPDMDSLVALGTGAAWIYSTVALVGPGLFPPGQAVLYFESAAIVAALILLGRWFEARAMGETGSAVAALLDLRPKEARVLSGDRVVRRPVEDIRPGDIIELRAGERVPVDGDVVEGEGLVDQAMLTGEPLPIGRGPGDPVVGGTVNGESLLRIRASATGEDTKLAEILRMVEAAQASKLPVQALIDRITGVFVPAVLALAVLTGAVWLALGAGLAQALVASVSVLIIACPCAMGLATPMAVLVGVGRGAETGILFRTGAAIESLGKATWMLFDKTGTLTEGHPQVSAMVGRGANPAAEAALSALAARSNHPLAAAIGRAMPESGTALTSVETTPGGGVSGMDQGTAVHLGSARFLAEAGIDTAELARELPDKGETQVFGAYGGAAVLGFALTDPLRAGAEGAVGDLRAAGVKTALLSGDRRQAAEIAAAALGIEKVEAELMPEDKRARLDAFKADGTVAFVGDGINDGPALAAADVGIAIGTGTDVAIEAADVVVMGADPGLLPRALRLSRATMGNIRQNLFWAFAYNVALIPAAALGLLNPMLAGAAMAASSAFVVANALRLKRVDLG